MALLLLLPALLYILILIPAVQTRLVQYFTHQLSSSLNADISIGRIHFIPFKQVVINDLLVRDQSADTLLFIPRFQASVDSLNIKQHKLYLNRVSLVDPLVNIYKVDSVDYNFSFLTKQFLADERPIDSAAWKIFPSSVVFVRGAGRVGTQKPNQIDYRVEEFNLALKRMTYFPDSISFELTHFSFVEQGGLRVKEAQAQVGISDQWLMVRDFSMAGNHSSVLVDSLMVHINGRADSLAAYSQSKFFADITLLELAPEDIALISKDKWHLPQGFNFSGILRGTPDNIKGREILLGFGENSSLMASFDLKGLPDLRNSFLFFDIKSLSTNASDIAMLASAGLPEPVAIPKVIGDMGEINYSGNITGFLNDLVAYGRLRSDFGVINTDLGIRWKEDNKFYFAGSVVTRDFRLGRLLNDQATFGNLSMSVAVSGSFLDSEEFFTYLDGRVQSLQFKGYNYRNIQLSGLVNPRRFDGQVLLNDPNGQFRFMGKIDYEQPLPQFAFEAEGIDLDVEQLSIYPQLKKGLLSFGLEAYFTGESIDDVVGEIGLSHFNLQGDDRALNLDSLSLTIERMEDAKRISLRSNIMEGELTGLYNFKDLAGELQQQLSHFSPALASATPISRPLHDNIFDFKLRYHAAGSLIRFFYPDMDLSDEGSISGRINSHQDLVELNCEIGDARYNNLKVKDLSFWIKGNRDQKAHLNFRAGEMTLPVIGTLFNFSLQQNLSQDSLVSNVFWNNWGEKTNSGAIYTNTKFNRTRDGLRSQLDILPSMVMVQDSVWHLAPASVSMMPGLVTVSGFKYHNQSRGVAIDGVASASEEDELRLKISNIDLGRLLEADASKGYLLEGVLNAQVGIRRFLKDPIVNSDLDLTELVVNRDSLGTLNLHSQWSPERKALHLFLELQKDQHKSLSGGGELLYETGMLDLSFKANQLPVGFLNFYLDHIAQNIKGSTSGTIHLGGNLSNPELSARLNLNPTTLDVALLKTSYTISDSVILDPDRMNFRNLKIVDKFNNRGVFGGSIRHDNFSNMDYDLRIECRKMLALDTRERDNSDYYGTVFADGSMGITGKTSDIYIDVAVKTMQGTNFFIPLNDDNEATETNFIRFVSPVGKQGGQPVVDDYQAKASSMDINFDLEVTPDARIQVIFDAKTGDLLKGTGNGNINVRIDKQGKISFFGEYILEDGNYLFSFQNIVNKRFLINSGSSVRWEGDPYDARINLNATYKLKASLYDLVAGTSGSDVISNELRRRVPINCNMYLTDRILRPNIRFEIETPSTQDVNQNIIDQYITSEEELNRQVLSLLILNKFYTPDNAQVSQNSQSRSGNNAALVTTTEVLSSQLSSWLSQISNDFDVGVAYRPGDEITNEEIEVALSTQIFNNRVLLNGNLGYGRNQMAASNIIGDFDVEVKLNNRGTVRAKAYTHSNNDLVYETSPTTQGVGLSFREEFDTFGDLLRKYWAVITGETRRQRKNEQLLDSGNQKEAQINP